MYAEDSRRIGVPLELIALTTSLLALGAATAMCGVATVITVLLRVLPGAQGQTA